MNKPLCRNFLSGYCKNNEKCEYSHQNTKIEQPICKLFLEGSCKQGQRCRFSHLIQYNQQEEQQSFRQIQTTQPTKRFKQFIEISKSKEGKEIFDRNQKFYLTLDNNEGDFVTCMKEAKSLRIQDLLRVFRRYQSSFQFMEERQDKLSIMEMLGFQNLEFQFKYTSTTPRSELSLEDDILEGYFLIKIKVADKYPDEPCRFEIQNDSLPDKLKQDMSLLFNRIVLFWQYQLQTNQGKPYSILKTIQFIDNHFNKFCDELKNVQQPIIVPTPIAPTIITKWSQDEQVKLEEGIMKFKSIIQKEDKWNSISSYVGTKDVEECLARFQYCKQQAIDRQNEKQSTSESEEEEDDDDQDEDEEDELSEEEEEENKIIQKIYKDDSYLKVIYNQVFDVEELELENISLLEFNTIIAQVECRKCHLNSEITLQKNKDYPQEYLVNEIPCSECNIQTKSFFKVIFLHANNSFLGHFGSFTWKVKYIIKCGIVTTCHQCDFSLPISNYMSGNKQQAHCRQCFQKGLFSYQSINIEAVFVDGIQNNNNTKQDQPLIQFDIHRPKKVGIFKAGLPLPQDGACRHYKSSHRWYRFPCCGKAFACDNCHFEVEKHEMELAKNMICGFCSQEQTIKPECQRCNQATCQVSSGQPFWEGGKGIRNRTNLSINDSHKYKGLAKTVSKKKQLKLLKK